MIVCLILVGISYILLLLGRQVSYKNKLLEYITIGIVIVSFCLVAGLRINIGDTETYIDSYNRLVANPEIVFNGDIGFNTLTRSLTYISSDPQILIFVTAVITTVCNLVTLARYRNLYELQVYLYVTSGFFLTTMNGIRQALVASVLFAVSHLILKGKFILYLIIVLFLSTFHQSALVMIPVYFIARQKAWSKLMLLIMVGVFGIVLAFDTFLPFMFDMLANTQYGYYEDYFMDNNWGGSSLIRTIINFVPVIFAFIMRKELKEKWDESDLFVNMSFLNALIMTLSLKNWIFARFSYYFQPFNFVLLPFLITILPKDKERRFVYYLVLICYLIFMLVEQTGLVYQSNFSLF